MPKFILAIALLVLIISCGMDDREVTKARILSDEFKKYWFENGAEINVYELKQARYGQERVGNAVLVFVTEPFEAQKLVKADEHKTDNIPVLKLNFLKKFNTGVYDYSMMTSDFFPLTQGTNALKITSSSQEWCGHTFMQLENRKEYELRIHSYFESEGEQQFKLKKLPLEDDLFNQIRIDPDLLPKGSFKMIPSFFYLRLKHKECKGENAEATLIEASDSTFVYALHYPESKRDVQLVFTKKFPRTIVSWKETYPESWTDDSNIMSTEAVLSKQIRLKYWEKNGVADSAYRTVLGLPK